MSGRKKWKVRLLPTFTETSARSEAEAYRVVQQHREGYAAGTSRVTSVVVLVHDGDPARWFTGYERINFADETASR